MVHVSLTINNPDQVLLGIRAIMLGDYRLVGMTSAFGDTMEFDASRVWMISPAAATTIFYNYTVTYPGGR